MAAETAQAGRQLEATLEHRGEWQRGGLVGGEVSHRPGADTALGGGFAECDIVAGTGSEHLHLVQVEIIGAGQCQAQKACAAAMQGDT